MERTGDRIELAALVAAVSLAADLASGVTLEHGLRTCLLATRLAERAGLDPAARRDDTVEPGRAARGLRPLRVRPGLPLGLQIVAPAGGEQTVLVLAAEIERLRP